MDYQRALNVVIDAATLAYADNTSRPGLRQALQYFLDLETPAGWAEPEFVPQHKLGEPAISNRDVELLRQWLKPYRGDRQS